jgi:hypothetical protein
MSVMASTMTNELLTVRVLQFWKKMTMSMMLTVRVVAMEGRYMANRTLSSAFGTVHLPSSCSLKLSLSTEVEIFGVD